MLVLTCKPGGDIFFHVEGKRFSIRLVKIESLNKVRIGIDAPHEVVVFRGEVQSERDAAERLAAMPERELRGGV